MIGLVALCELQIIRAESHLIRRTIFLWSHPDFLLPTSYSLLLTPYFLLPALQSNRAIITQGLCFSTAINFHLLSKYSFEFFLKFKLKFF